jgi:hypothetical protein
LWVRGRRSAGGGLGKLRGIGEEGSKEEHGTQLRTHIWKQIPP